MTKTFQTLGVAGMLLVGCAGLPAAAGEVTRATTNAVATSAPANDAARAQALLDRAVAAYEKDPGRALVDFSMVGPYQEGDLYVYVVGANGVMQASGGSSVTLVGRDVRELRDAEGKQFIKEMLAGARNWGSGSIQYRWLNGEHGRIENKVAYYRKSGDAVIAVGYYNSHATPDEARAMLARAVDAVRQDPKAAFARINDINGGFVHDDVYVFVVGIDDHVMHASGGTPRLVGRKVDKVTDISGKRIFPESVEVAKAAARGTGELRYTWLNPVTRRQESKITYLERVGDYAVGVGYYPPQPGKQ
ncbi:MAG: cache domain-containing protein [Xanthomonadales bacterium]|jgi:cytochrome c|nr:cache domain-containing protein [Xanthomonadales bacterium]